MKNNEKIQSIKEEKIIAGAIEFNSKADAKEFERLARGRKFCKKGEKISDICEEEIERKEYENLSNIIIKILKTHKLKSKRKKFMIENRLNSNVRAIAANCIRKENEELNVENLTKSVKNAILEEVEKYEREA